MHDVKYIVLENETLVMFSPYIQHADMNLMLNIGEKRALGAGFVSRSETRKGEITFSCYGKSVSLGVPSREKDTELANIVFGTSLGAKRKDAVASYLVFEDVYTGFDIMVIYPAWVPRTSVEDKIEGQILSRGVVNAKLECQLDKEKLQEERIPQKDEEVLQKIFNPCFV